jgi:hypothetical protein
MSFAQAVTGYCFHSTNALVALAMSRPDRHAATALNLISVKNQAAQARLDAVSQRLDVAETKLFKALDKYQGVSNYVQRHSPQDLCSSYGEQRWHNANFERYAQKISPHVERVQHLYGKMRESLTEIQKYESAQQKVLRELTSGTIDLGSPRPSDVNAAQTFPR